MDGVQALTGMRFSAIYDRKHFPAQYCTLHPSIATLETICKGFGITMAQFFAENDFIEVTPDLKELIDCWISLVPEQKKAALQLLKSMNANSLKK